MYIATYFEQTYCSCKAYENVYSSIILSIQLNMEIIYAPAFKIRINKVGRYYRIYEILPECMLPNIQPGDVIVSIGHNEITGNISVEALHRILQESDDSIEVVKYRTAVARDNRTNNYAVVINGFLYFCFILYLTNVFHTFNRCNIGIHLAELAVVICTFIYLLRKKKNVVLKELSIL